MNTKRIIAVTNDEEIISFIKIKALTLTKLNHQVTVDFISNPEEILSRASDSNTDMIIVDLGFTKCKNIISDIRKTTTSSSKKIFGISKPELSKEQKTEIFSIGCDSIMSWKEFTVVIDNVLMY